MYSHGSATACYLSCSAPIEAFSALNARHPLRHPVTRTRLDLREGYLLTGHQRYFPLFQKMAVPVLSSSKHTIESPVSFGGGTKGFTPMKRIVACIFGLLLVGCGATLPPPTNLAVLIALTAPTPTMISESEPTKKKGARAK